jgi:hypothetical protein
MANPYQSPYPSQSPSMGGHYATADSRSSLGATGGPGSTNQWSGAPSAPDSGSTYGQGSMTTPPSYPSSGGFAPSSYPATSAPAGFGGTPDGFSSGSEASSAAGLAQNGGPYRPGSTGRNGASLPAGQQPMGATPQGGGFGYPTTASATNNAYPSTGQY